VFQLNFFCWGILEQVPEQNLVFFVILISSVYYWGIIFYQFFHLLMFYFWCCLWIFRYFTLIFLHLLLDKFVLLRLQNWQCEACQSTSCSCKIAYFTPYLWNRFGTVMPKLFDYCIRGFQNHAYDLSHSSNTMLSYFSLNIVLNDKDFVNIIPLLPTVLQLLGHVMTLLKTIKYSRHTQYQS
jgi:hypothetical protein